MIEPLQLQSVAWALTTTLELGLFAQLVRRKIFRTFPFFLAYLTAVILQSAVIALLYRDTNLDKVMAWKIAWLTQGLVVCMRALVLLELNRTILSRYVGIWALARRLFLCVAVAVIAYDLFLSKGQWQWLIMNGIRGLELAMATVIVTMLIFARYYRVHVNPLQRALAVGLCLYSSFYVISYSLLDGIVKRYMTLWNFLEISAFVATLLVWLMAVNRYEQSEMVSALPAIPAELYGKLSSEVNSRLLVLNRQLIQFLRVENRGQ
jgi:hypothetical protein